jgi:hypothetical protein
MEKFGSGIRYEKTLLSKIERVLMPQLAWLYYFKVGLDWPPSRWTMNL